MSELGFKQDIKITDVLNRTPFTLSAEILPPRNGVERETLLTQLQSLITAGAQFLAVTKGAGGSLRSGSLPIAHLIKERFGLPCIAHMTCRDLNPFSVENQAVELADFGIRNILALRGDPPEDQPDWKPGEGSYLYAYQLVEQLGRMNQGLFLPRPGESSLTRKPADFCIGGAVYPELPHQRERLDFFRRKVDAGIHFAITQMLFDHGIFEKFLEECAKAGITIPVLPGTRVLRSKQQAQFVAKRFGIRVPKEWENALPDQEEVKKDPSGTLMQALDLFSHFTDRLKKQGAAGVHVFVIFDAESSVAALERLKKELTSSSL